MLLRQFGYIKWEYFCKIAYSFSGLLAFVVKVPRKSQKVKVSRTSPNSFPPYTNNDLEFVVTLLWRFPEVPSKSPQKPQLREPQKIDTSNLTVICQPSAWCHFFLNCQKPARIGANPEKSDLLNFRGPDWRKFSEPCVLLLFLGKTDKNAPKIPV